MSFAFASLSLPVLPFFLQLGLDVRRRREQAVHDQLFVGFRHQDVGWTCKVGSQLQPMGYTVLLAIVKRAVVGVV